MKVQERPKTGWEKWQSGIDSATDDARWNAWDCEIRTAVGKHNRHLSGTPGYRLLDWQLVKAMVWVETGAVNADWNYKPMRIGAPCGAGLSAFLSGKKGGDLILQTAWTRLLTTETVRSIPSPNIRADIGYC